MAITLQAVPQADGTPPTFAAPLSSDTCPIGVTLIVKNGGASPINVTLTTPATLATGDAYPDKVIAVPAGAERWIPIYDAYLGANGVAAVAFSALTSVTVAAIPLRV